MRPGTALPTDGPPEPGPGLRGTAAKDMDFNLQQGARSESGGNKSCSAAPHIRSQSAAVIKALRVTGFPRNDKTGAFIEAG